MCGICGIVGLEDKNLIKRMCNTIVHRGPDDDGIYIDKNVGLGHRRLSIIDLKGGHQPIHNEDETIWITFNGEIYNFKELRKDLEKKHNFYTNTDTEVIIHCYEEYGYKFVEKLNGMFAFAIWDSSKKELLLARDPIGKKPLYYYIDNNIFIFASEIKAILETGIKKALDLDGLCAYLSYQYTIGEGTLFKGIKKLLGGSLLILKENNKHHQNNHSVQTGKQIKIQKYWDIQEKIINDNEDYLIKKLRLLLEKSARYRLIADVSVGAFLSGGIDSSCVVALSKPYVDYEFHTFCAGFETFSEFKYAKMVSDSLDTNHHEIMIDSNMVSHELDKIAWHYDEPLGDAAIINNYFLSKEARKYVKVVLAGEAGDEIFAGYPNYQKSLTYYNFFKIPLLNNICMTMTSFLPIKGNIYENRIEKFLGFFSQPNFERAHLYSTKELNNEEIKYLSRLVPNDVDSHAIYPSNINGALNKMLALDCKNLLPEKFLMKADKATMANSVEERLPLLDKNIIEFAFSIPSNLKLRNNQGKYILKQAVKDLLPEDIIKREKQGFGTPVDNWISEGDLKDIVIQKLSDNELITRYFRKEKMYKLIQSLNHGNILRGRTIWTIFALGLWYDIFLKEN